MDALNATEVAVYDALPEPLRSEALFDPKLAKALQKALQKAMTQWPTVIVSPEIFYDFLAARIKEHVEPVAAVRALYVADLYFACGCWIGDAAAATLFQQQFWPSMIDTLRKVPKATLDDLRQSIWVKVFVDDHTKRAARIHQYRADGNLIEWLRVATVRQYIDDQRKLWREELTDDDDILHQKVLDQDPELCLMRMQYAAQLQEAISAVMADLSVRDRNILRFHLIERMSIDQICILYRAHRATVARWIVQIKARLIKQVYERLKTQLDLQPHELVSLMRMIKSNFQGSLRRHLATS